jgi:hypothetical protein
MKAIVYLHLWLGAIVGLTVSALFYGSEAGLVYSMSLFCGVIVVYNTHTWIRIQTGGVQTPVHRFMVQNKTMGCGLISIAALVGVYTVYALRLPLLPLLLPGVFVVFYEALTGKKYKSRGWLFCKPIVLWVVWTYYLFYFPSHYIQSIPSAWLGSGIVLLGLIILLFENRDAVPEFDENRWQMENLRVNGYYIGMAGWMCTALTGAQTMVQIAGVLCTTWGLYLLLRTRHCTTYFQKMFLWDGALFLLVIYVVLSYA